MTYRAELSGRALKQMHGLPGPAFDRLIEAMAEVIDYPDDPLRTLPTSDPYIRRVEFGGAGLITYLKRSLIRDVRWRFAWFQGQACSGEAALDEGRPVLDLLQAVPDDLDQVAEAGDGEIGQHAAFKH